jgi:uncharacterized protein with von Willebrand factor type A (vWA) domain
VRQPPAFDAAELQRFEHLGWNIIVFGRALRAVGLRAQPDRMILLAEALRTIGFGAREDVKAAASSILVRSPEEIPKFDVAFETFWSAATARDADAARNSKPPDSKPRDREPDSASPESRAGAPRTGDAPPLVRDTPPTANEQQATFIEGDRSFTYSFAEGLYQKEFSHLTPVELETARELTKRRVWDFGLRYSRRTKPGHGGDTFDHRRTLRGSLRRGGEVLKLDTRERRQKQRDLVLLCDISGSMDRYSRLLLQFVHTVRHAVGHVEAFVFGTRLTRITRELRHREVQAAIDDVSHNVADWAGGTRIGECLREFNRHWGKRVLSRGAIVIVISDGWDRGDIELLASEMRRLQRSAYRLIWLNPLLGSPQYRPQTVGMQAALPYIDDFLPAHNLKSLMQLAALLRSVENRRPARAQAPFRELKPA